MEKYSSEIQQIHNEVMNSLTSQKKATLLYRAGFSKNPEALSLESKKHVDRYAIKYPNYKYVTEQIISTVCQKYDLIYDSVRKFVGFVPEKNLDELFKFKEIFNLDLKDGTKNLEWEPTMFGGKYRIFKDDSGTWAEDYSKKELRDRLSRENSKIDFNNDEKWEEFTKRAKKEVFFLSEQMLIVAPKDQFHIKWNQNEVIDGKVVPKDPIVLQPVKGEGFLIVTAWGDESQDPEIFNEKQN